MPTLNFVYRFILPENREEAFEVHLDEHTLDPVDEVSGSLPDWTRLDFHQCPNCPRTALFKPMARFHLPMANGAETIYRASSMYLLSQ